RNSKVTRLGQVTALLDEHSRDLPGFFASHPKGQKLPAYLAELSRHLEDERKALLEELSSLGSNTEHINEIVARQQSYARVGAISESLNLADLVEDAIRFDTASMERDHIQVVREFAKVAPITADKHKVLQILINLISNARYAVNESGTEVKRITVRIEPNGSQWVKVSVIDNGLGIPAENLTRIFQQGFSTRKNGHGFGLHGSAVAAKQMGGSLIAQSDGPGKGACFVLELPLQTEKAAARQQAAAVAAARTTPPESGRPRAHVDPSHQDRSFFDDEILGFQVSKEPGGCAQDDGFNGMQVGHEFSRDVRSAGVNRFAPAEPVPRGNHQFRRFETALDLCGGMNCQRTLHHQLAEKTSLDHCLGHESFRIEHVAGRFDDERSLGFEVFRDCAGDVIVVEVHVAAAALAHRGLGADGNLEFSAAFETGDAP